MICKPCKDNDHHLCPSNDDFPDTLPPTGLSPEGNAIQRGGLCPCHHRYRLNEKRQVELVDS